MKPKVNHATISGCILIKQSWSGHNFASISLKHVFSTHFNQIHFTFSPSTGPIITPLTGHPFHSAQNICDPFKAYHFSATCQFFRLNITVWPALASRALEGHGHKLAVNSTFHHSGSIQLQIQCSSNCKSTTSWFQCNQLYILRSIENYLMPVDTLYGSLWTLHYTWFSYISRIFCL